MDYFLKTERLGFREWKEDDLNIALGLWGDDQVTKLIGGPFKEEKVKERLQKEIDNGNKYGVQYWPIFLLKTEEHVGCCGLRPYQLPENIYEIGFHIRSKFWKQGFATEAAQAVINYAFNELKVSALFAGHNPNNEVSRHVLSKLGFTFTHEEFYPPTGLMHPSYILNASKRV